MQNQICSTSVTDNHLMKKSLLIYIIVITIFTLMIGFVLEKGKSLKAGSQSVIAKPIQQIDIKPKPQTVLKKQSIWNQFINNVHSPLGLLLLQIITILLVSKIFGAIFSKLGQPSVVGEMAAGIFLGPSLIGFILPEFSNFLFPPASLINLQFLSQIGLTFFMFIIGMDLDIEKLRNKAQSAIVISHASIIFPYFLGVCVSYILYEHFAPANVSFLAFALFMGIAVSITAFPVLAKILQERGLTKTPLGALAITCAAFDDVTAWCILAAVIAIIKAGSIVSALITIALALLFVLIMYYGVRPWLKKMYDKFENNGDINKTLVIIVFFVLLTSALITELIGIHALFGAFLAGVIMPQKLSFKELLTGKIEDVSVLLLLPLFFALTGLRTTIGLLNDTYLWSICGLILFVAVLGKLGGSTFAAKLAGLSWKESFSIGVLMNTRGLMELIVLNIGYDLGILSPSIFSIMVIMALLTTFMTGPLMDLIERKKVKLKKENPLEV